MPGSGAFDALDQIEDAVVVTDSRLNIRYMNAAAARYAGCALDQANRVLNQVLPVFDHTEHPLFALQDDGRMAYPTTTKSCTLRVPEQPPRRVQVTMTPKIGASGQDDGWTIVISDRTRETGLERRLAHQASHDALTNLPNRRAFEQSVEQALLVCQEVQNISCAVLYLDIDLFKLINDTCGHAAGDQYLIGLAEALRARVRDSDVLARLGGDEFGILLHGCTVDHALTIAGELRDMIKQLDCVWEGHRYQHTVSIGVAPVEGADQTVSSILSGADVACFAAKDRGRDRVEDYGHGAVPEREAQMHWVSRVARACDDQRFVLYQQPIVPLANKADVRPHYELLLRMVDRGGKVIMPGAFIHAAERYNIMPRVDRWAVKHALSELVWRADQAPAEPYTLSVNLSGTSLSDASFRRFVIEQLDANPIARDTLCFEVTETAAIANIAHVATFMRELHERNCQFSLDDFGTGLSSFAYLKDLPVDYLKIDGQFIRQLLTDKASVAFVRAFQDIGSSLGIKTVAERVEDQRTACALAELGVHFAQGFFFARPRKLLNRLGFKPARRQSLAARLAV